MANKIVLPLVLALVLGFGITTAIAFQRAASLFDDAGRALARRTQPAAARALEPDAPVLVAARGAQ